MQVPKKFSVLLLYPDYISDNDETWYGFTTAKDADDAIRNVQADATRANQEETINEDDFKVLLITSGWNKGLAFEG